MLFTELYRRLAAASRGTGFRRGTSLQRAFLSRRQFEREISRERIRASRRGIPFCIVSVVMERGDLSARSINGQSTKLGRILLRKLRVTDEKAMLSRTEFAAILVDTAQGGGRAVISRLAGLFEDEDLRVHMELKVHDPSSSDRQTLSTTAESLAPLTWRQPDPAATLRVGVGRQCEVWTEPKAWQSRGEFDHDRRTTQGVDDPASISSQADELVSSDDPLVMPTPFAGIIKRSIDIVGALIGLVLLGPLLMIAMAVIRWTSPGGAIFKQTREGYRGKPFTIYKLRTMIADAESSQQMLRELSHRDGPAFKIKSDPRVTKIGGFLRATCIDELPQLVNVLYGHMSLVGPRPLPWHESRACIHWHRRRLDVRPGLTCFWQIKKSSVASFDEWMRLDLEYVDRGGLLTDAALIYRTLSVALLGRGSH